METENTDSLAEALKIDGEVLGEDTNTEDFFSSESKQEEDTSEESQSETNKPTDSPSQEGEETEDSEESSDEVSDNTSDESSNEDKPVAFHDHPRWKKLREEKETLEAQVKELSESQTEIKESIKSSSQPVVMPSWFKTLAGDDEVAKEAFTQYQAYDKENQKALKASWLAEQKAATDKQATEATRWNDWVEGEITALKEEGLKFDRNELQKVAVEFQPLDEDGNISLRKSYEILQMQKGTKDTSKAKAKKKVAAKTTSDNKGDSKEEFTPSTNNLRHQSTDSLMEKLGIK